MGGGGGGGGAGGSLGGGGHAWGGKIRVPFSMCSALRTSLSVGIGCKPSGRDDFVIRLFLESFAVDDVRLFDLS